MLRGLLLPMELSPNNIQTLPSMVAFKATTSITIELKMSVCR